MSDHGSPQLESASAGMGTSALGLQNLGAISKSAPELPTEVGPPVREAPEPPPQEAEERASKEERRRRRRERSRARSSEKLDAGQTTSPGEAHQGAGIAAAGWDTMQQPPAWGAQAGGPPAYGAGPAGSMAVPPTGAMPNAFQDRGGASARAGPYNGAYAGAGGQPGPSRVEALGPHAATTVQFQTGPTAQPIPPATGQFHSGPCSGRSTRDYGARGAAAQPTQAPSPAASPFASSPFGASPYAASPSSTASVQWEVNLDWARPPLQAKQRKEEASLSWARRAPAARPPLQPRQQPQSAFGLTPGGQGEDLLAWTGVPRGSGKAGGASGSRSALGPRNGKAEAAQTGGARREQPMLPAAAVPPKGVRSDQANSQQQQPLSAGAARQQQHQPQDQQHHQQHHQTLSPQSGGQPMSPQSLSPGGSRWAVEPKHLARYEATFRAADVNQDGFLEASEAKELLEKPPLGPAELSQIWHLADVDQDGRLTFGEFVCAMHMVRRCSKDGALVPAELPAELHSLLLLAKGLQTSQQHTAQPSMPMRQFRDAMVAADPGFVPGSDWNQPMQANWQPEGTLQPQPSNGIDVSPQRHSVGGTVDPSSPMSEERSSAWTASPEDVASPQRRGARAAARADVAAAWPEPSQAELEGFCDLIDKAGLGNRGPIGAAEGAKELLEGSGLPHDELSQIWRLSDVDKDGRLAPGELLCAMVLAGGRRRGLPLPGALPPSLAQLVARASAAANNAGVAQGGGAPQLPEEGISPWQLDAEELERYCNFFKSMDTTGAGVIGPEVAREVLESSQLPVEDLSYIWDLADTQDNGQLTLGEFVCAMTLVARRRQGLPLPPQLPPELERHLGQGMSSIA